MGKPKTLYMETTTIDPAKTIGEIMQVLVGMGALGISVTYANGKAVGLQWQMNIEGQTVTFVMPNRMDPILQHLKRKSSRSAAFKINILEAQAERVAWRQILRWVEAQAAFVDSGLTDARTVFLPYAWVPGAQTTLSEAMFLPGGPSRLLLEKPEGV